MPLLKNAVKKLRQDKVRAERNKKARTQFRSVLKSAKLAAKEDGIISRVFSVLDLAAKKKIIHKKKADRLKSRFVKFASK